MGFIFSQIKIRTGVLTAIGSMLRLVEILIPNTIKKPKNWISFSQIKIKYGFANGIWLYGFQLAETGWVMKLRFASLTSVS